MTQPNNDQATGPIIRVGIAVIFLCCAALAIAYAWYEAGRNAILEKEREALKATASEEIDKPK